MTGSETLDIGSAISRGRVWSSAAQLAICCLCARCDYPEEWQVTAAGAISAKRFHPEVSEERSLHLQRKPEPHEDNWGQVQAAIGKLPRIPNDRPEEDWELWVQVAAAIGGEWPDRINKAAILIIRENDSEEQMFGVYLIHSLRILVQAKNLHLENTKELTQGEFP